MSTQQTVRTHGMLFKPDMVVALLAGNKSQTRRLITRKNSTSCGYHQTEKFWKAHDFSRAYRDHGFPDEAGHYTFQYLHVPFAHPEDPQECHDGVQHRVRSRYEPGDLIWVRESWWVHECYDGLPPRDVPATDIHNDDGKQTVWYRNNVGIAEADGSSLRNNFAGKVRQSIFMPKWAARIWLRVISVMPQRLREMTPADAASEGVTWNQGPTKQGATNPITAYRILWDQINGTGSWDDNNWVWRIEFKRELFVEEAIRYGRTTA